MKNNFIKKYGKIVGYFLFILFLSIPNLSFASQCSKDGYTVVNDKWNFNIADNGAKQNEICFSMVKF